MSFVFLHLKDVHQFFGFFFFFFVLQDSTFPPLVAFPFTSQTPMGTPDSCLPSSAERMLAKAVP
jgi:hypothetical protein